MFHKIPTILQRCFLRLKTVLNMSILPSSMSFAFTDMKRSSCLYSVSLVSIISISSYNARNVPVRPTPAEQWTNILTSFVFAVTNLRTALTRLIIGAVVSGAPKSGHPTYCKWSKACSCE